MDVTPSPHYQNTHPVKAWAACIASALFFFYIIFQMSVFNTLNSQLLSSYHISAAHLGSISSLYFYFAAFVLLPAGTLLDKYSTRTILLIIMGISIIGTLIFALFDNLWAVGIYRALCGIGNAFAFLGCMRMASVWFSAKRMALVMGMMVTIGMLGGAIQPAFAALATANSWRAALWYDVALGGIFYALMFGFLKLPCAQVDKPCTKISSIWVWQDFKQVLSNTQNWYCSFYTALLNLPVMLLAALWGNAYLMQTRLLTSSQASAVTCMIFFGLIAGSPLIGWISDHIGSRRKPMVIGAALSLLIALIILYIPTQSYACMLVLFFILGILSSSQILSYPTVTASNPLHLESRAMALISIIIYLIGALAESSFGWILNWHMHNEGILSVSSYDSAAYQTALFILPLAFAVSLLLTLGIKEAYGTAISRENSAKKVIT